MHKELFDDKEIKDLQLINKCHDCGKILKLGYHSQYYNNGFWYCHPHCNYTMHEINYEVKVVDCE